MNPVAKTLDQHKKANQEIAATTGNMAEIYRKAREWLNDALRQFVLSGGNPSDGKWLVELINELERNYGKLEEAFVAEMKRAIPYVAESYYFDALHDLGNSVIGKIDKNKIEILQRDAFNHVAGMTQNMMKSDVAFIRQASADVFRLAGTSGMTAEQTKQMLLGKILMRPEKFQFVDAGGRTWDNESYCKMLSRTVLLNAGRQSYFDACAANGDDVVRVTVSGNPCPACAVWENRLLSISGATEGLPTVSQATAAGLCHPNCTHSFVAVGEFAQQEDFNADGRPKEGVNSPGREEKDNPEAWKKYRNSLKPKKARKGTSAATKTKPASTTAPNQKQAAKATAKPAKANSTAVQQNLPVYKTIRTPSNQAAPAPAASKGISEEHRAKRREQWEAAYDKRRDAWHEQILKDGGSKEVADELADAYTPGMAKLGKTPKIVFGKGGAFLRPKNGKMKSYEIHLDPDASSWDGHPLTARHEFGHWIDHHTRLRDQGKIDDFNAAAAADWKELKKKANGNLKIYKENLYVSPYDPPEGTYWQEASLVMFGKSMNQLNLAERKILRQHQDALGSITNGNYGGGHTKTYYRVKGGRDNKEAFAQAYAAYCRNDKQFRLEFPNMSAYIEKMMKGLEK